MNKKKVTTGETIGLIVLIIVLVSMCSGGSSDGSSTPSSIGSGWNEDPIRGGAGDYGIMDEIAEGKRDAALMDEYMDEYYDSLQADADIEDYDPDEYRSDDVPNYSSGSSECTAGCRIRPSGCDIKGNISFETKDKIYHLPNQKYYDQTTINPDYGERWFCTEEEARANGWRKAMQ